MICKSCGCDNGEENAYCFKCGDKLINPGSSSTKKRLVYHCPRCGETFSKNGFFCGKCGDNLHQEARDLALEINVAEDVAENKDIVTEEDLLKNINYYYKVSCIMFWLIIPTLGISFILLIMYLLFLLYYFWQVIPKEEAKTTPLKAVLLLLVPIFYFYWNFVAFVSLSKSFEKISGREDKTLSNVATVFCLAILVFYVFNFSYLSFYLDVANDIYLNIIYLLLVCVQLVWFRSMRNATVKFLQEKLAAKAVVASE